MQANKQKTLRLPSFLLCFAIGAGIWFAPRPEALTPEAWHVLAVFVATIVALLTKPLPMGVSTLVSACVLMFTNTLTVTQTLSGFSHPVVWLIVAALFIAQAFIVTGLGQRIAYVFTRMLGGHALGLSYGLAVTDLLLAPAVPSVTGRSAGIVYPILQSIAKTYGSEPNSPSARKLGAFLIMSVYQVTVITSAMFLTAMAANPLLSSLSEQQGYPINWIDWFVAAIVPGLTSLIIVPFALYKLYPPSIKKTPEAPAMAAQKLKEMGRMSAKERILAGTLTLVLSMWILGGVFHIAPVTAAFIGVCILIAADVIIWENALKLANAWETFIWFAVLLMMANALNTMGVIAWFSDLIMVRVDGIDWHIAFPLLAIFYFYSHYFFASSTAHVSAMYVPILVLAIAVGTPPMLALFILLFFSILYGGLTHYSFGPAPILFSAGYVPIGTWWRLCFIISIINIFVWGGLGSLWWKILGYW